MHGKGRETCARIPEQVENDGNLKSWMGGSGAVCVRCRPVADTPLLRAGCVRICKTQSLQRRLTGASVVQEEAAYICGRQDNGRECVNVH